jgi:hypothetical protein
MKRFKKKPLIITLVAIAATVGITTGLVFAQDEGDATQPEAQHEALLDRVCEIYEDNTGVAIDPQALQDAFTQAQDEIMAEAMQNRLDALVEKGIITQDQADQYKAWWEARPDTVLPGRPFFGGGPSGPGFGGRFGPRLGGPGFPGCLDAGDGAAETSYAY